jgi:ParB family transcriptional regulator, chromosome partitioning protein
MAKKRPRVSLAQSIPPQAGDLEKLFTTDEDVEQASGLQLLAIRIDAIRPDPAQPRRTFLEESLLELSESIKQDGVIQPIEVTETAANEYMIVHGERRWRAAQLADLETIPAVVRRRDYDTITRFVRQMVENIQREDLNDVDRAAGLLYLKEMMQTELDAADADEEDQSGDTPWSKTVTWAKVGKRLGFSRQRIHQLIRLLDLPEEIKEDVRQGRLRERDTRIYQGLRARQQRELHRLRVREDLSPVELRQVARQLKEHPSLTISKAVREVRHPAKPETEPEFDASFGGGSPERRPERALRDESWTEGAVLPPRQTRPTNIDRLDYIRGHLARVQRLGLSAAERREILRLLDLIAQDVASLRATLQGDAGGPDG